MNFKGCFLLSLILICFPAFLTSGETNLIRNNRYVFSIRFLGMKVTHVEMTDTMSNNMGCIEVHALSTRLGSLLFRIDNLYVSKYKDEYVIERYEKFIDQKNYTLKKETLFDTESNEIETWIDGKKTVNTFKLSSSDYSGQIKEEHSLTDIRNFFTTLLHLKNYLEDKERGTLSLYANNNIWQASIEEIGKDRVARRESVKYRIDFSQQTQRDLHRSDILTNNIFKDGSTLYLWLSADSDRLPLRAEYEASPVSVFWVLESYQIEEGYNNSSGN